MNRLKYSICVLTSFFLIGHKIFAQTVVSFIKQDVIKTPGITSDSQISSLTLGNIETTNSYKDGLGRIVQNIALRASPNSNNDILQSFNYNNLGQQPMVYLPYVDNTGKYANGTYRATAIADLTTYYQNNNTLSNPNKVAADNSPFSQQLFENSPLQRVLASGMVGAGFQPGVQQAHYKSINYRSNTTNDNVLQWDVSGAYIGNYSPNVLTVTDIIDEDGAENLSFKDVDGKTILNRQLANQTVNGVFETYFDTYYIYNAAGLISYIVPPRAVSLMENLSNYSILQAGVVNLIFSYQYNTFGELVQKQMPGVTPLYIIYDPLNRPVLIQDGNLRSTHQWAYIKYDYKNHPISQGIYTDNFNVSITAMQAYVNSFNTPLGYGAVWYEKRINALATGYYTNMVFPTNNYDGSALLDLAYTYYDDYSLTQGSPNYIYKPQALSANEAGTTYNEAGATSAPTTGMPTIVRKKSIGAGFGGGNIWLIDVVFYDKNLHPIQVQSNNQLNYTAATTSAPETITDWDTTLPDFVGKSTISKTIKNAGSAGTTTVLTSPTYDANNKRLLYVDQTYNTQPTVRIASYEYNEMGQLVKKNMEPYTGTASPANISWGPSNSLTSTDNISITASNSITFSPGPVGSSGAASEFVIPVGATASFKIAAPTLQSVDLRYNIRGQLQYVNNSQLIKDGDITNNDSNDLFGMQIMYDLPDAALNDNVTVTPSYSGRVSAIKWMTVDGNFTKTNERSYKYSYDLLDRLSAANYAERAAGNANFTTNQGGFDEAGITYDENGNILSLNRNSSTIGATSNTQFDQLLYSYNAVIPNQLLNVSDGNNSSSSQYTGYGFQNLMGVTTESAANLHYSYYDNGNLKSDPYKGLAIAYNVLNKTDNIQFSYNASGRKINYTYDASGNIIRKQQFDQNAIVTTTDYIGNFVYLTSLNGTPSLSYFPMNEGRVINSNGTLKPEYIITDHQGNARFSFQDDGTGKVKIIQENSYYAFGLVIPNSPVNVTVNPDQLNKRLFNGGSEWQNDYNSLPNYYGTLYRNYDPAIGRFIAIDPVADAAHSVTPYQFANNNPISFNDPLGNVTNRGAIGDGGGSSTTINQQGGDDPGSTPTGNDGDQGGDFPGGTGYYPVYILPQNEAKPIAPPTQHYQYIVNSQGQLVNSQGQLVSSPTPIEGLEDKYYEAGSLMDDGSLTLTEITPTDAFDLGYRQNNHDASVVSTSLNLMGQSADQGGVKDMTAVFDKQINKTREFFSRANAVFQSISDPDAGNFQLAKILFFTKMVKTNAPYDLKNKGYTPNIIGEYSLYHGHKFHFDDYGNFNYGVAAKAYGLSLDDALEGAGLYQVYSGGAEWNNFKGYFDHASDTKMIIAGYNYFKE